MITLLAVYSGLGSLLDSGIALFREPSASG
jgi:hypothetical protein